MFIHISRSSNINAYLLSLKDSSKAKAETEYNRNAALLIGGPTRTSWLHSDILPTLLQETFCPKGNYDISKPSDINKIYRNIAQHAGESASVMDEVFKTPNPTNVDIFKLMQKAMPYKSMHDYW